MSVCDAVADLRAATPSAAAAAACASRDDVKKALSRAGRNLSESVQRRVRNERRQIESLRIALARSSTRMVTRKKALLGMCAAKLNALSPLATLSRGYAVARDEEGTPLTSVTQFAEDLKFELLLRDGRVRAKTLRTEIDR